MCTTQTPCHLHRTGRETAADVAGRPLAPTTGPSLAVRGSLRCSPYRAAGADAVAALLLLLVLLALLPSDGALAMAAAKLTSVLNRLAYVFGSAG